MIVNAQPLPGSHEYHQAHGTWFPQGYHPYQQGQGKGHPEAAPSAGSVQGAASQTVTTEGADPSLEAAALELSLPAAGLGELSAESVTDPAVDPEAVVPEEVVARYGYNPSLPSVRAMAGYHPGQYGSSGYPGGQVPPYYSYGISPSQSSGGGNGGGAPETSGPSYQTLIRGDYVAPPEDYQHGVADQWNYYPDAGQGIVSEIPTVESRHGYNPAMPTVRAQEGFAAVDAGPFPTHGYWPLMNQMPFAQQFRDFAQEHGTYNPNLPTVRRFMGTRVSATATPDTASSGEFSGLSSLMGPSIVDYLREHYQAPEQYPDRPAYGPVSVSRGVSMNRGGMVDDAMRLQNAGTGDHNRLVHMTQGEVDAMNQIVRSGIGGLRSNGMAINPETGLPEAGFFKDILPSLVGIGAMFVPGMQPWAAGLLAGGTSMLTTKGDLGRSILAGLGAWGGASLGQAAGAAGGAEAAGLTVGGSAVADPVNVVQGGISSAAPSAVGPATSIPFHSGTQAANRAALELGRTSMGTVAPDIINQAAPNLANISTDLAPQAYASAAGKEIFAAAPWQDQLGLMGKGFGQIGTEALPWSKVALPGLAAGSSLADTYDRAMAPDYDYTDESMLDEYDYRGPYLPRNRDLLTPPEGYQHGIDPAYQYYSYANKGGYVGGLPTIKAQYGLGGLRSGYEGQKMDLQGMQGQPQNQQPGFNTLANMGAQSMQQPAQPQSIYSINPQTAMANVRRTPQRMPMVRANEGYPTLEQIIKSQQGKALANQPPYGDKIRYGEVYENVMEEKAARDARMRAALKNVDTSGTKFRTRTGLDFRIGGKGYKTEQLAQNPNLLKQYISRSVNRGSDFLTHAGKEADIRNALAKVGTPSNLAKIGTGGIGAFLATLLSSKSLNVGEMGEEDARAEEIARIRAASPNQTLKEMYSTSDGTPLAIQELMFNENKKAQGGIAGLPTVMAQEGSAYTKTKEDVEKGKKELIPPWYRRQGINPFAKGNRPYYELEQIKEAGINSEEEANRVRYLADELRREGRGLDMAMYLDITVPHILHQWDRKKAGLPPSEWGSYTFGDQHAIDEKFERETGISYADQRRRSAAHEMIGADTGEVMPLKKKAQGGIAGLPTVRMAGNQLELPLGGTSPWAKAVEAYKSGDPSLLNALLQSMPSAMTGGFSAPVKKKALGGPVDIAADGLMAGADPAMQAAVAERDMVPTSLDQPQDAEERAVYDRALLALQGQLENEEAQRAVNEFIEVFGAEALAQLEILVNAPRDRGGIVKTANGQDTVGMSEEDVRLSNQGPDVIPGKIIDPQTGRQTANLRVGQDEYIMPADGLEREAMAAGLPPTAANGATVVSGREEQLRQMYG